MNNSLVKFSEDVYRNLPKESEVKKLSVLATLAIVAQIIQLLIKYYPAMKRTAEEIIEHFKNLNLIQRFILRSYVRQVTKSDVGDFTTAIQMAFASAEPKTVEVLKSDFSTF